MYKSVKPTTFTLPLGLIEDLNLMAKELNKKKTQIVTEALEMYMDYQDLQIAQSRLNDNTPRVKADDFFKELGA